MAISKYDREKSLFLEKRLSTTATRQEISDEWSKSKTLATHSQPVQVRCAAFPMVTPQQATEKDCISPGDAFG